MGKVFRILATSILMLCLLVACGTQKRVVVGPKDVMGVVKPALTDSSEIAASRAHAAEVAADARASSGARPANTAFAAAASTPATPPEPAMSQMDSLLAYAKTFIGTPYQWAANGPSSFDCSGFVKYVYHHFGYELPRSSTSMSTRYPRVEHFSELRPGDLIFFGERNNIRKVGHVGILVNVDEEHGSFWFIHASVNNGVEIQRYTNPYYMMRYIGAGRVIE